MWEGQEFGLNGVPHPPVFFARAANKGVMGDGVCKSDRCRT